MHEIIDAENDQKILELMKNVPRLEQLSIADLKGLIRAGKLREFKKDEIIIKEGEYDCFIYLLVQGKLEIFKSSKSIGYLKRSGDMFGEMGIIDGSPRSATIKANNQTLIFGIDASLIDQKLKSEDMSFCYIVYRLFSEILVERLRATTEINLQLRDAVARCCAYN
jgi:CRP-like cAMP-binding protein